MLKIDGINFAHDRKWDQSKVENFGTGACSPSSEAFPFLFFKDEKALKNFLILLLLLNSAGSAESYENHRKPQQYCGGTNSKKVCSITSRSLVKVLPQNIWRIWDFVVVVFAKYRNQTEKEVLIFAVSQALMSVSVSSCCTIWLFQGLFIHSL